MGIMRMIPLAAMTAIVMIASPLAAQQRVELPARDRTLAGAPSNVFAVGREEGEDYELFAGVTTVGFDGSDNLYVLDSGNQRVVVFDARGRYVRTIGRRGQGPGEFSAAVAMSVARDGSILVADVSRASLSHFGPDGAYGSIALPTTIGRPMPGGLMRDALGGVAFRTQNFSPEAVRSGAPMTSPLVRLASLDEPATATTLFEFPLPAPQVREDGQGRTLVMMVQQAFAPQPLWTLGGDGSAAVAFGTDYRIEQVDREGRVRRIIERPLQPRRVTRADREREVQRRMENAATGTAVRMQVSASGTSFGASPAARPQSPDEMMRNLTFAEVMPVLARMSVDPGGRLWAQRTAARVGDDGPIDIIAADGSYVGTLPPQPLPAAFSESGLAAWIVTDELGVQRVAVRRLPQQWRW